MKALVPFFVDNPELGFKRGRSYPGHFSEDGRAVLAFNDDGQMHRLERSAVRLDVAAWRRSQQLDATVPDATTEERMSIAVELRELWTAANEVPHKGNLRAVRAALRGRVRNIMDIVDPEAAKELWNDGE